MENQIVNKTQLNISQKTDKTDVKQGKYYLFQKGKSGNPKGRPKGSKSIKDAVRQYLQRNPTEFTEFVEHFIKNNREMAWQMLEGKPPQDLNLGNQEGLPFQIEIGAKKQNAENQN